MNIHFDLHFTQESCRPLTPQGKVFLNTAHLACPDGLWRMWPLNEIYELAVDEGLHVSFENSEVLDQLTHPQVSV